MCMKDCSEKLVAYLESKVWDIYITLLRENVLMFKFHIPVLPASFLLCDVFRTYKILAAKDRSVSGRQS